jgi:hypothetical protein
MTDLLRPLPAFAGAACYPGHVGDPRSHVPLSGDARHEVHAGSPHMTRCNHARCDGVVLPARHVEAQYPILKAGSSSEDRLRCEGGEAEMQAADRQGRRKTDHLWMRNWQCIPGRSGDHLHRRRVCQGGCVPGATDGSMPVGSGRLFMHFSSISRTHVLSS